MTQEAVGSTRCHSLNQFLPRLLQGKGSAVTPSVSRLQGTGIICPKGTVGMPTATAGSSHIPWTPGHNQGFQAGTTAPWSWFAWQLPQEQPDRVVTQGSAAASGCTQEGARGGPEILRMRSCGPRDHRITKWFGSDDLKDHPVPIPCHGESQ